MGVGEYAAIQVEHSPWIKGQEIRAQSRSILPTVKTTHNNTPMDSGRLFLGDGEPQWQPYWYSSYLESSSSVVLSVPKGKYTRPPTRISTTIL